MLDITHKDPHTESSVTMSLYVHRDDFIKIRRHFNCDFFSKTVILTVTISWVFFKDVPSKYCSWPVYSRSPSTSAIYPWLPFLFFCLLLYFQLPASQIIKCQSSDTWHFNEHSVFTTRSLSTALLLSMRAGSVLLCWTEVLLCCRVGRTEERWTRAAAQNWEEGGGRFPNFSPCHLLEFMSSIQLNQRLWGPLALCAQPSAGILFKWILY